MPSGTIPLRLETDDLQIAFDLLSGDTALQPGVEIAAPGGARLRFRSRQPRGPGIPRGRLDFELIGAQPDSVDRLTSWLYQTLHDRLPTVEIGRKTVNVEPGELRNALQRATTA